MPTIDVDRNDLFTLTGRTFTEKELDQAFMRAKAERKGTDGNTLRVELADTNRPDLWCVEGIARALAGRAQRYACFDNAPPVAGEIEVAPTLARIRPYIQVFRATGAEVSETVLAAMIQTQEKLAEQFGRKRAAVSIGIYRADGLTFPLRYEAVDPDRTRMPALGDDRERTMRDLGLHEPGTGPWLGD